MAISSWLSNNKVETSFIKHKGYVFLVYTKVVSSHQVVMIEEVQSAIRIIPTEHPVIESASDMDEFVRTLMDSIIEDHFPK